LSFGIPVTPICHVGFGYPPVHVPPVVEVEHVLWPPLPATMFTELTGGFVVHPVKLICAQLWFHGISGM
jgi:hypothetical protein